jgi:hypothetical protein
MKKLLALLLLFGIVGCSDEKVKAPAKSYYMILTCKMNPNALYTDKFYFDQDMSSVKRTSNNKSARDETYSIKKISSKEYKLKGYRTGGLFVLKKENASRLWGLYYEVDYDTDPFRFMSCMKS